MGALNGPYIDSALSVEGPYNDGAQIPATTPEIKRQNQIGPNREHHDAGTAYPAPEGNKDYATDNAGAVSKAYGAARMVPAANAYTNGGMAGDAPYL